MQRKSALKRVEISTRNDSIQPRIDTNEPNGKAVGVNPPPALDGLIKRLAVRPAMMAGVARGVRLGPGSTQRAWTTNLAGRPASPAFARTLKRIASAGLIRLRGNLPNAHRTPARLRLQLSYGLLKPR